MPLTQEQLLEELRKEVLPQLSYHKDFPKEGVTFVSLDNIYRDSYLLSGLAVHLGMVARQADFVIAPEARGWLFGAVLASVMGSGFIGLRKPGKTPPPFIEIPIVTEYSKDVLVYKGDSLMGKKVILYDDVVATGGTLKAILEFLSKEGAEVVDILSIVTLESLLGDTLEKTGIKHTSIIKI